MNRFVFIASFVLLLSCKQQPKYQPPIKDAIIGNWYLVPYKWDTARLSQKFFEIDSRNIVYKRVIKESSPYIKRGDTLFLESTQTREPDTLIIKIKNNDTAVVVNRHGGEDYFIVRTKE